MSKYMQVEHIKNELYFNEHDFHYHLPEAKTSWNGSRGNTKMDGILGLCA